MDLQQKVTALYQLSLTTPSTGFSTIAEAELYLQQAYEGRFLFELIQNVRDANKAVDKDGEVLILLENDLLTIANTGAEFNEQGIEAITTIGRSGKQSQDLIGFKGIGFKSVQAISDIPKIITRFGSVFFDRSRTAKDYPGIDEEDLPLFYCPHFDPETLTEAELTSGIVTKVALKLKRGISEDDIVKSFERIQVKELVMLGNINKVEFRSPKKQITYLIDKRESSPLMTVTKDGIPYHFKIYSPPERIQLPREAITTLSKKERKLFQNDPSVELKIVMELNEKKQVKLMDNTKLYLFYPLEIVSGFRFIIHSYFIVDPERKSLRASPVNEHILKAIGGYLASDLLKAISTTKTNITRILTFKRQPDEQLQVLYDHFVENLKGKKFIYDEVTKTYYTLDQVMIADGFDKDLFPDGKLNGRQLVYIEDQMTLKWLLDEFDAYYLEFSKIAEEIEAECKKQAKAKNASFFQNLYNYVTAHEKLNLTGKRVLLTDQWQLVSSEEDVLYGGNKKSIKLSPEIKRKIHFIHPEINITDFREGRSRTGIVEYSTYQLTRRLLKLMAPDGTLNAAILNDLNSLELDNKSWVEIQEKILLPVKDLEEWISPIYHPIYLESAELRQLYPEGKFVDEAVFKDNMPHRDQVFAFLKLCGVWNIPAVYVSAKGIYTSRSDEREKKLIQLSGLSTTPFSINNDRLLDIPANLNDWFSAAIFNNWGRYQEFIGADYLSRIQFSNSNSYSRNVPKELTLAYSGFLKYLKSAYWISFKGEEDFYRPADITGIDPKDFFKPQNQVIKRYLKVFPVAFAHKKLMLDLLGMRHLDGDTLENYTGLLTAVYDHYRDRDTDSKEFTDFYNRLLNKLFDFYYFSKGEAVDTALLAKQWFLALDEVKSTTYWKRGAEIFYIDDRPNYDILPFSIKQVVQPQFTLSNKQTFGKIAAKIGTKFSDAIARQLLHTDASKTSNLPDYFEELPQSIAILEYMIDKALDKELDLIKNTIVKERASIRINVSVATSPPIPIETDYFVDRQANYELHIKSDLFTSRNKVMAEAINALFVEITNREPRRYRLELYRFLNSRHRQEYLHECEITEERLQEIREKLSSSTLTGRQKFWDAVLLAKSINDREAIFNQTKIDLPKLALLLETDSNTISEFSSAFQFRETSKAENLGPLKKLLQAIHLTLAELNAHIYPKLDFRYLFDAELSRLKNKFENGFNANIHRYLKDKKRPEQQAYLARLDEYRSQFKVNCPVDLLINDPEEYFLQLLRAYYDYLLLNRKDIQASYASFNLNPLYLRQLKQFKLELKSSKIAYTEDQVSAFKDTLKWGSLFYFEQTTYLVQAFKAWLASQQPKPELRLDEAPEDLVAELDIREDEMIEDVTTESIPLPEGNGSGSSGGSTGSHYDGAANDAQKQKIGLAAELVAYKLLAKTSSELKWVSKNASRAPKNHPGYNPQGDDKYGYDIEYLDADGNKHFVEVKGRGAYNDSFEITKYEVQKAYQTNDMYQVILITHTLDSQQRRIRNLGNLFMLDKGKDFFSNDKFTAIYKSFEIRFHQI
ncbi:MAG: hypothetical protein JWQ63_1226 [Mucilaginibacter sp.]|nr:hypothetical protein [Mucilaginibacter sp.]